MPCAHGARARAPNAPMRLCRWRRGEAGGIPFGEPPAADPAPPLPRNKTGPAGGYSHPPAAQSPTRTRAHTKAVVGLMLNVPIAKRSAKRLGGRADGIADHSARETAATSSMNPNGTCKWRSACPSKPTKTGNRTTSSPNPTASPPYGVACGFGWKQAQTEYRCYPHHLNRTVRVGKGSTSSRTA